MYKIFNSVSHVLILVCSYHRIFARLKAHEHLLVEESARSVLYKIMWIILKDQVSFQKDVMDFHYQDLFSAVFLFN